MPICYSHTTEPVTCTASIEGVPLLEQFNCQSSYVSEAYCTGQVCVHVCVGGGLQVDCQHKDSIGASVWTILSQYLDSGAVDFHLGV